MTAATEPVPRPLSAVTTEQRADVARGLGATLSDVPVAHGYVQAVATLNRFDGAAGRLEAGIHPWKDLAVYGAGTVDRNGPGAELGARWTF